MLQRKGACDIADSDTRRVVKERNCNQLQQLLGQGVRLIKDRGRLHGSDCDGNVRLQRRRLIAGIVSQMSADVGYMPLLAQ